MPHKGGNAHTTMIYSEPKTVSPHDLDENNIASASAILRYLQDSAYGQMYNNPPSMDDLRRDGKTFLLSRIAFTSYQPLKVYDKLISQSWACESKGASYLRCGRLLRGDDVVAELMAIWALIDIPSKRLLRVSEYPQPYTNEPPLELEMPTRLRIPKDAEMSLLGEYTVFYRDVDLNRHINNTNYPNILCSMLPDMSGKRVTKAVINYNHEAALGNTIQVYSMPHASDPDTVLFRTVRPDGQTNVEAEMTFKKL